MNTECCCYSICPCFLWHTNCDNVTLICTACLEYVKHVICSFRKHPMQWWCFKKVNKTKYMPSLTLATYLFLVCMERFHMVTNFFIAKACSKMDWLQQVWRIQTQHFHHLQNFCTFAQKRLFNWEKIYSRTMDSDCILYFFLLIYLVPCKWWKLMVGCW